MPKKKLPKEVVQHWPEVFGDIDVKVIPLDYLESVVISFEDGTQWEVALGDQNTQGKESIEDLFSDLFDDYANDISSINFSLDTERVKKDIQSRTRSFMKKRK